MFKKILIAVLLLLIPYLAYGQAGFVHNDVVFDANGHVVPSAAVTVCSGFNVPGAPCSPPANSGVFTDSSFSVLLNQTTNPILTDGSGNYVIYVAPGNYTVTYSRAGFSSKSLNFSFPCVTNNCPGVGGGGGGSGAFSYTTVPSSSTPNFNSTTNTGYKFTLTSNATATFGSPVQGTIFSLDIIQDGVGGHTFTFPNNVNVPPGFAVSLTSNVSSQVAFIFDGSVWQPWQTQGPLPLGNTGDIQAKNGSLLSPTSLNDTGGVLNIGDPTNVNNNVQFRGPNPYTDVTRYGVRSVNPGLIPAIPGVTGSITSGQTSLTLSSASSFQNGDGVTVYGAGASCPLTAPSGVTVTPSVTSGPTGTGLVVNAPTGATSYSYQVIAVDRLGCFTAASTVASTSTGSSALGSQTATITGFTQTGNTVTATTSSATGIAVGADVIITAPTAQDAFFYGGRRVVVSTPDTTHFTFATGTDVADGAPTASVAGGSVFYFNENHISWTSHAGDYQYYIYGRSGGSLSLIGVTFVNNTGAANTSVNSWDDFGATMEGNQVFPYWVPNLPPVSPGADMLVSTICSGAGTTTLTLCNGASNTVTNNTVLFDNAPNILTAAQAVGTTGLLYFPAGTYPINSHLTLPTFISIELAGATLDLNATLEVTTPRIYGMMGPQTLDTTAFGWPTGGRIVALRTSPGLYDNAGSSSFYEGIQIGSSANAQVPMLMDGGSGASQSHFKNVNFVDLVGIGGGTDYMGIPFVLRGGFWTDFDHVLFASGPGQQGSGFLGASTTPGAFLNTGGLTFKQISVQDRGIFEIQQGSGMNTTFLGQSRAQGIITPFFTVYNAGGGGGSLSMSGVDIDTSNQARVAILGGNSNTYAVSIFGGTAPTLGYGDVTGIPIGTLLGTASGQNFQAVAQNNFTNNPVYVTGIGEFMVPIINGTPPGLALGAGGLVPVGPSSYAITTVDVNGNESAPGPFTNITIPTGNQTVTITPPAAPVGAVGYFVYRGGANANGLDRVNAQCFSGPASFTTNVVDSTAFSCGHAPPTISRAASQSVSAAGLTGSQVILSGGGFKSTQSGTFTANRAVTWPDLSLTVAGTNVAQTFSANQTIDNSHQLRFLSSNGTNYAGFQGGASTTNLIWLFPTTDSSGTQCLSSNGSLQLSWSNCSAGTGTPGGANTQVQFNNSGSFGGSANLTWVSPALSLGAAATATGQLKFVGTTSGTVTVQSQDAAGTWSLKLPTSAGTSGLPLITDGTGVASWTALGTSAGGTGTTSFNNNQMTISGNTGNLTSHPGTLVSTVSNGIQLKIQPAGAAGTALVLDTAASPTGDVLDINLNGTKTSWFDSAGTLHAPSFVSTGSGPAVISGTEGTCPSPSSGQDILCLGDVGSHTAQLSNNGTSFKPIVEWTNTAPTAHGLVIATPTGAAFPQQNSIAACNTGITVIGQGAAADPICSVLGPVGGGTGLTTLTAHGVLVGEGTSNVAVTAAGASGVPLLGQGAADPAFSGVVNIANGGTGASSLAAASIATVTGTITAGDCVKWSSATVVTDFGAGCGSVGSVALSAVTAGTGSNTINSTVNPQTWNWALTGSTTAFQVGENTAATGSSNILFNAHTLNTSTAIPFRADNNGNGYQLSSTGLWQPLGTGTFATPGAAHNLVVSQASSTAVTYIPPVAAGKVLIDNGPGNDPSFQDPIVSLAFVNIWTAQDVTTTRTSANVRNPLFSQTGTLQLTWASVTGSPATCTLQIRGVDSQGNVLNDGSTFSVSPANGTTSQTFTAASTLQTAAQISAVFTCVTYPTTGTLTLDFTPIPNVNVTNTVTSNVAQFGGSVVATGTGASGAGIPRVTISNDSSLAANQSVNVNQIAGNSVSTAATGVQKVGVVGNTGATVDQAPGSAVPTNAVMEGLSDGTNTRFALSDSNGRQLVKQYPDTTTTSYHASKNVSSAASATDIAVLPGNATNTVLVNRVIVTCTQTTAGIITVQLIKRSTADTAGTSSAMTAVQDDSNYAAGVSAPLVYTANPTTGTAVGNVDTASVGCMASGTAGANDIYVFRPVKPIVLRGTAQQLAVNLNGVTVTGGSFNVTYEYSETTTP